MKSNFSTILLLFIMSVLLPPNLIAGSFTDSFETGDFSATDGNGFKWRNPNKTDIVNSTNGNNWQAKVGNSSLRFLYPADNFISEQRFELGKSYPEIWIRYWLRVPKNFKHNTGNTNNKLLAIWMDEYEFKGYGPTVVWQYRNNGNNGSNTMFYKMQNTGVLNDGNGGRHSGELQTKPFISYPADQGRWMQLVFHVKAGSSSTSSDGVVQMYRRWEGEAAYKKIHEDLNVPKLHAPANGPSGFKFGYLMGWANAPYASTTEWLLDDFTVSDTSLLTSGPIAVTPNAPIFKSAK